MSFSIYTREAQSGVSIIKFGGYDEEGLAANTKLTVLRTDKNNQWGLNAASMVIGERLLYTPGGNERIAVIEPQLPYLYLPTGDY